MNPSPRTTRTHTLSLIPTQVSHEAMQAQQSQILAELAQLKQLLLRSARAPHLQEAGVAHPNEGGTSSPAAESATLGAAVPLGEESDARGQQRYSA